MSYTKAIMITPTKSINPKINSGIQANFQKSKYKVYLMSSDGWCHLLDLIVYL